MVLPPPRALRTGCREDDALAVGPGGENDAFAVGVQQPQVPQRRGHRISEVDLVQPARKSQRSAARVMNKP